MDNWSIELKSVFLDEASQTVLDNDKNFLALEADPSNADLVSRIFRLAHQVKGSAKAVGFSELGAFTHEFESMLLNIRINEIVPSKAVLKLLWRCHDHVRLYVKVLKENQSAVVDSTSLVNEIHIGLAGGLEGAVEEALSSELAVAATIDPETLAQIAKDHLSDRK